MASLALFLTTFSLIVVFTVSWKLKAELRVLPEFRIVLFAATELFAVAIVIALRELLVIVLFRT